MQECLLMSKDGHAFLKLNYPLGLDTTLVNLATKYSSWSVDCDRVISSKGENISGVLICSPEQQTKKNATARRALTSYYSFHSRLISVKTPFKDWRKMSRLCLIYQTTINVSGKTNNPDCYGLTPDELSRFDFSQNGFQ